MACGGRAPVVCACCAVVLVCAQHMDYFQSHYIYHARVRVFRAHQHAVTGWFGKPALRVLGITLHTHMYTTVCSRTIAFQAGTCLATAVPVIASGDDPRSPPTLSGPRLG